MSEEWFVEDQAALEDARAFMKKRGMRRSLNTALLVRRALDHGVEVTPGRDGRAQLAYQGRTAWFRAGSSNLNQPLAKRCVTNKEITSRLLRSRGLRAPENCGFAAGQVRRAWQWAEAIAPVVVKPAAGGRGRLVHVGIEDFDEFEWAFDAVAAEGGEVLVEQSVTGVDHRVTVINGKVVAATRRTPPNVVGDGSRTVAELIEAKNIERRMCANPVHKQLKLRGPEIRHLKVQGLTADSVPAAADVVQLRSAANVSTGGDAVDATDDLSPEAIAYVERAGRAIPGLRMGGFDVLLDGRSDAEPWILEVNSIPMISPHHFPWDGQPRDVMSVVLQALFPALREQGDEPSTGAGRQRSDRWRKSVGLRRRLARLR